MNQSLQARNETRHEQRLLAEWEKLQEELRKLRALQAWQVERLYAQYKPELDNLSFMVSMERWTEEDDEDTY